MTNSVYDFIEAQEGRVLHSYLDSAGVWTIGVGSTMYQSGRAVGPHETITDKEADELLEWEIRNRSKIVRSLCGKVTLTDQQTIALISFAFNAGMAAFRTSSLLKVIRKNPNDTTLIPVGAVADTSVRKWMVKNKMTEINIIRMCFLMWNKVTNPHSHIKEYSESLLNRRLRESHLYFS